MNRHAKKFALFVVTLFLAACGGGGGSSSGGSGGGGGGPVTTRTATVAFSVVSTAKLPAAIQGVTLIAALPPATTVSTDPGRNTITASTLSVGSGITDPNLLLYGTYSAAANKVRIGIVAASNSTFRGGEFARLSVSYPSTTTLTLSDFTNANTPAFPLFQAAGFDAVVHSIFDMTGQLKASQGVTFN